MAAQKRSGGRGRGADAASGLHGGDGSIGIGLGGGVDQTQLACRRFGQGAA